MRVCRLWIIIGLLITTYSLSASAQQPPTVSGPILGFVKDHQGSGIRPIFGILGASVLGQRLDLPIGLTDIVFSPNQDYAIAVRSEDAQEVIVKLDGASPTVLFTSGSPWDIGLIGISPTGSAAVIYARDPGRLLFISGLPDAPALAYEFDPSTIPGSISTIAVSDDAQFALVVTTDGENQALWLCGANGFTGPLGGSKPSLISFIANGHDAVFADDATHEIVRLQDIDQGRVTSSSIFFDEMARPFAALTASRDGRTVFVAQRSSDTISMVDLELGTLVTVSCGCNPTEFFPLKGKSVFRLNGSTDGPITVLDASSGDTRIVLIPPDPPEPLP